MADLAREWPAPWVRAVLGTGVLAVLADEDLHGYAITERLAQRGLGRPRGGSLYPLLESLQQDGAIEASWTEGEKGPGRRTYRLTEHHTAGGMSRTLPYLAELQPEFFCEVSPELAAERGLDHLGWATIIAARTAIEARVLVTERIKPLRVRGRVIHQVGLPYHWGSNGLTTGDAANDLLSIVLDPNVHIQEAKAATCDIRPGRRPRGPALLDLVEQHRNRADGREPHGE